MTVARVFTFTHSSFPSSFKEQQITWSNVFPLNSVVTAEDLLASLKWSWVCASGQQDFSLQRTAWLSSLTLLQEPLSLFPWDIDVSWLCASGNMSWKLAQHDGFSSLQVLSFLRDISKQIVTYWPNKCLPVQQRAVTVYTVEGGHVQLPGSTASYHWAIYVVLGC